MSTLKVNTLQNTSGVEVYTAKAWVNFNGTGTVAIRASGNVSSITDNGTGSYTINFTNAMPDANYSSCFTTTTGNTTNPTTASIFNSASVLTSSVRIGTFEGSNSAQDYPVVCATIFR